MQLAPRWLDRNLSRLELIVSVTIIMLFIGAFVQHMLIVVAHAERSMVDRTVTNINTSLKYHAVFDLMKEDYRDLAKMGSTNPMSHMQGEQMDQLLSEGRVKPDQVTSGNIDLLRPGNYIGEFAEPDPTAVPKGSWYYDTGRRQLVYIVRNTEFFSSDLPGVPRLRFRVKIDYTDIDGNGKFDPPADEYRSVHLQSMDRYEWAI